MAARKTKGGAPAGKAAADVGEFDRRWHLADTPHEISVTELEYSLFRVYEAFLRWQSECLAAVSGKRLSGPDNAVLHVIRMNDRSKAITEIARLLNRDDIANLQYSIRKLLAAGLIEKTGDSAKKGVRYQVTAEGRDVTERYAKLRKALLMKLTRAFGDWESQVDDASRVLDLMTGIYDQAARVAATHRTPIDD